MAKLLRFAFESDEDREGVEADIALAIFAAECIHGRPRVRMETRYLVSPDGKSCVIEVGGASGEAAARVFAGLASARFGDRGFNVSAAAGSSATGIRTTSPVT